MHDQRSNPGARYPLAELKSKSSKYPMLHAIRDRRSRLKILCVTPWFPARPGEQRGNFVYDSVEALSLLGHQVTTLVCEPWRPKFAARLAAEWGQESVNPDNYKPQHDVRTTFHGAIPRNYLRPISNAMLELQVGRVVRGLVAELKPDIIHGHTESLAPVIARVGKELGIPTAITLHGINTEPKLRTARHHSYIGRGLANVSRVILVGRPLERYFSEIIGDTSHVRVVHNGFRAATIRFENGDRARKDLRFISVSNLQEGKGIDLTLKALGALAVEGRGNWTYTVVGDGPQSGELKTLAANLNLTDKVTFTGAWPHARIFELLRHADVFVLPSLPEAFGIAYLEAMSAGLLAIGVAGQGPEAFIRHGRSGLLLEGNGLHALTSCLRGVIDDPASWQAAAFEGQRVATQDFTLRQHALHLTEVLVEACQG